jgi:hypothetical protein
MDYMLNRAREAKQVLITTSTKATSAPFFVVGSDRSGTTMLMMMLDAICRFQEIPFDRGLLSWHERAAEMTAAKPMRFQSKIHRAPRPEDLERWKNELPTIAVAAVECMAGDIMQEVGHSRRFSRGVRMLYSLFMIYAISMSGLKAVWRTPRIVLRLMRCSESGFLARQLEGKTTRSEI